MSLTAAQPVVVGISAGHDEQQALEFALDEARSRCAPIRLVHGVAPPSAELVPAQRPPSTGSGPPGSAVLEQAITLLRARAGSGVQIVGVASPSSGLAALLQESREAALVVVQRGQATGTATGNTGTAASLAAGAACPVALVSSGSDLPAAGPVVVGVTGATGDGAALRLAFEEAALRQAPLVAVHAWGSPSITGGYGGRGSTEQEVLGRREQARRTLAAAVEEHADAHPAVEVQQRLLDSPAGVALLHVAVDARLLVLGRGPEPALGLGSLARHCLASARCPVIVAPSSRRPVVEREQQDRTADDGQARVGGWRSS